MASISFRASVGKVYGLQFSQDGKPRFSFSAAENHSRFNKQTNQYEETGVTWYMITVFGKQAEDLADIVQEGQKQFVVVSGRQATRFYESNGEQRSSLDVVADHVGLVHRAQTPQSAPQAVQQSSQSAWGAVPQGDVWAGGGQQQGGPAPF